MFGITALLSLLTIGGQDQIIATMNEPRRPTVFYNEYLAQCGRYRLSLSGISGGGARFESPTLKLNRRSLSLTDSMKEFLSSDRSTYRISAACPPTTPAVQLIIYRAQGLPNQPVSYELRALDISSDGGVTDRGIETVDADAFWFR